MVVIIPKGKDKDPLNPKSYRPVLGKVFEDVICSIMEEQIGHKLSKCQHGFRPLKSTATAIKDMVDWTSTSQEKHVLGSFLDISGAFDNVRWPQLKTDMKSLGCSAGLINLTLSYLNNRTASYSIGSYKHTIKLTRGCPQGSKFGPRLWNITMNPLLETMKLNNTKIIAYADDIALLVTADTRQSLVRVTEAALSKISEWDECRNLQFSREKCLMVTLKGGLVPGFTASFSGGRIHSVASAKYLGLQLGSDLSFDEHSFNIINKSTCMFARLKGVRRAKWGVSSALALLIYKAVYLPRILYGAEFWYPRIKKKSMLKKKMCSAQRQVLLAITGAYRTTSTPALQVLAGVPPLDIEIKRHINIKNRMDRDIANRTCEADWQKEWDSTTKGRWTYRFFRNVGTRAMQPVPFGHYIAQLVTGHGDFNAKLHGFTLTTSPACKCGDGYETAEHVLWKCPLTNQERRILKRKLIAENIQWSRRESNFTKSPIAWNALCKYAEVVLIKKETNRKQQQQLQQ